MGRSVRKTGWHTPGWGYGWDEYGNPGYFTHEENHVVVMVEPLENERWEKPYACLVKDLEWEE